LKRKNLLTINVHGSGHITLPNGTGKAELAKWPLNHRTIVSKGKNPLKVGNTAAVNTEAFRDALVRKKGVAMS